MTTNLIAAFLLAIVQVEQTPQNPYGLTAAAIRDVNQRTGSHYRLADRAHPIKSREIVVRYVYLYHPRRPFCPELAGRIVNGGPLGRIGPRIRSYGERVANLTWHYYNGGA